MKVLQVHLTVATWLCTYAHVATVDADDHDTVRHEVWHVIQHCLTPNNSKFYTVICNLVIGTRMAYWAFFSYSQSAVDQDQRCYPETHHNAEIEAFAVAQTYDCYTN
jgi:hypothetical protein